MAPSDDWRPYTIPYSGEGALKRSDGQWVPSSQVLTTPYAHHHHNVGDSRPDALMDAAPPCGPPAPTKDTSATAASADPEHEEPVPDVPLSSHEMNQLQQLQQQHMSSFHAAPVQHARFVSGAGIPGIGVPSYSGHPAAASQPTEPTRRGRGDWDEDEEQSGGDGGAVSK